MPSYALGEFEFPIRRIFSSFIIKLNFLLGSVFYTAFTILCCNLHCCTSELVYCMQTDIDALASFRWHSVGTSTYCVRAKGRIGQAFGWCKHAPREPGKLQSQSASHLSISDDAEGIRPLASECDNSKQCWQACRTHFTADSMAEVQCADS